MREDRFSPATTAPPTPVWLIGCIWRREGQHSLPLNAGVFTSFHSRTVSSRWQLQHEVDNFRDNGKRASTAPRDFVCGAGTAWFWCFTKQHCMHSVPGPVQAFSCIIYFPCFARQVVGHVELILGTGTPTWTQSLRRTVVNNSSAW